MFCLTNANKTECAALFRRQSDSKGDVHALRTEAKEKCQKVALGYLSGTGF